MSYKEFKLRNKNIQSIVEEIIEVEDMTFKNRTSPKAHQRYFLMNYLRENTTLSLVTIGKMFGKNHATVINGIMRHNQFMEYKDKFYLKNIASIEQYLKEVLVS